MLVLSRKKEEKICIGPDVTITVLRVKGTSVKIGVEAPAGTRVFRAELGRSSGKPPAGTEAGEQEEARGEQHSSNNERAAEGSGPLGSSRAPRRRTPFCDSAYRGAGRTLAACG